MKNYKQWLLKRLHELDHPEYDAYEGELVVDEARDRAARLGLPDAVRACRVRSGPLGARIVRECLAGCLSACKEPSNEYLSVQQAAEYLGYSASGIRKLVRKGSLRALQTVKHAPLRFRREWLDEFAADLVAPQKKRAGKPRPCEFDHSIWS